MASALPCWRACRHYALRRGQSSARMGALFTLPAVTAGSANMIYTACKSGGNPRQAEHPQCGGLGRWALAAGWQHPARKPGCWMRTLQPVKTLPVRTQQGQLSRVSAVYDAAPPARSFIVALKDAPELGDLCTTRRRADLRWLCARLRHGRGPGQAGFLNPWARRTPCWMFSTRTIAT